MRLSMQVGDLVKFKKSGNVVVYLGTADALHRFYHINAGIVEFSAGQFDPNEKMELVSDGQK